ncbi:hypothetical protein DUT91_21730 [Phyllobacterium salinisoli]|uniref:Uncharacterized protein n=1 Tax=Phyllobacterium salinisoli TaxID=1899321 RepID=A0A368JXW8_9HYPH|nr:hypothetical protein [Phyllobacterium salinisoli]RCS21801.1 hypothetical protein DUT91_21730 [Phyllobacterium salinisoli]
MESNADQTYEADANLTLVGSGKSFDKKAGKTFIMNAPSRTLGLQITPSGDNETAWSNGTSPAGFDIAQGTFVYDARASSTELFLTLLPDSELNFHVRNDARALIMGGMGSGKGLEVNSAGYLNMIVEDEGMVAFTACEFFGLSTTPSSSTRIILSDKASMLVNSSVTLDVRNANVEVTSSKNLALQWYVGIPGDQGEMSLNATQISLSEQSSGILAGPVLKLSDTQITIGDSANCTLGFGPIAITGNSQFILASGSAKMQFSGQGSKVPFDFIDNSYPKGIFEIVAQGGINGGEFMIDDPTALEGANAMVAKGLIAIDGVIQMDMSRLTITNDGQFNHIRQTA